MVYRMCITVTLVAVLFLASAYILLPIHSRIHETVYLIPDKEVQDQYRSQKTEQKASLDHLIELYLKENVSCFANPHMINPFAKEGESVGISEGCVRVHLSTKPLPITALFSFPGSGNTWVRHIIQQLTGISTGSIGSDVIDRKFGFSKCTTDGQVVAFKLHDLAHTKNAIVQRTIILVRNPYDAILAELNRRHGGKTGFANKTCLKDTIFMKLLQSWYKRNLFALQASSCLLLLEYEDLKTDLRQQLVRLALFLGLDPEFINSSHINCVIEQSTGHYRRNTTGAYQPVLSEETRRNMDMYIKKLKLEAKELYGIDLKLVNSSVHKMK